MNCFDVSTIFDGKRPLQVTCEAIQQATRKPLPVHRRGCGRTSLRLALALGERRPRGLSSPRKKKPTRKFPVGQSSDDWMLAGRAVAMPRRSNRFLERLER